MRVVLARPAPWPANSDRVDRVVLAELGYLPFPQSGGQLLFHLISRLYERTSIIVTTTSPSPTGRASSAMPK
jgi:DNA replication protein DnaC